MSDATYQHHLPIGSLLGEYKIEKILGEGGFGVTYLVTDQNLDKPFAIKEYLPGDVAARSGDSTVGPKSESNVDDFQWGLERFLDEARTLATFTHPNLNSVQRFFKANGTAYMVLEYVKGETLADRLKRTPVLPPDEIQNIMDKLLSGLAVVHNAAYTHRDIKPANIMIEPDGNPVLLDFGAARQALGYKSKSITAILTPGYAPIEQYNTQAEDIGSWTDIYSLGMVAYCCLTGKKSKDLVESPQRAALQRKGDTERDLSPAVIIGKGKYDHKLLEAIDWSTQVYEEDRPRSVQKLQDFLAGVESTPLVKEEAPKTRQIKIPIPTDKPASALNLKLIIPIVLGLCVALGIGLTFIPRGDVALESGNAILAVSSTPHGAKVHLGEIFIGETPLEKTGLAAGDYTLIVSKKYFTPSTTTIHLVDEEVLKQSIQLETGLGKLTVISKPQGAEVWIDGNKSAQLAPMTVTSLPAGQHQIRIHLDSYYDIEKEIIIHHEQTTKISPELAGGNLVEYDGEWLEPSEVALRRASKEKEAAENTFASLLAEALDKISRDRFTQAETILNTAMGYDVVNKDSRIAEVQSKISTARAAYQNKKNILRAAEQAFSDLLVKAETKISANKYDQAQDLLSQAKDYNVQNKKSRLAAVQQKINQARTRASRVSTSTIAPTFTDPVTGIEFIYIPGGCYQMGSQAKSSESPVHEVCVDGFYFGKYEVTQGQYKSIMGSNPSEHKGGDNHPVEKVSWDDAQVFLRNLNRKTGIDYRLPTEAEWEYGARGGTSTKYYWGSNVSCSKAMFGNFQSASSEEYGWDVCVSDVRRKGLTLDTTAPIGQYAPNPFGLYDIIGNVWELCSDWYSTSYYGSSPRTNPQGPSSGTERISRGGCWDSADRYMHSAARDKNKSDMRVDNIGMRLVLPASGVGRVSQQTTNQTVTITDAGQLYSTINKGSCLSWKSSSLKEQAGKDGWGDFYPANGMTGTIIDEMSHCDSNKKIYLVKIRNYYIPIGYDGVEIHGATGSQKKVEITNTGQLYTTINTSDCLTWKSAKLKNLAGKNSWDDFYPSEGMTGVIIDEMTHCDSGEKIYLIKAGSHYLTIGSEGVKILN